MQFYSFWVEVFDEESVVEIGYFALGAGGRWFKSNSSAIYAELSAVWERAVNVPNSLVTSLLQRLPTVV